MGAEEQLKPRVGLVGPLAPPSGGMASQCEQLRRLLAAHGVRVELVQSNPPYRPRCVQRIPMVRALFRLMPYLVQLWQVAGRVNVMHVLANSGWAWYLMATPALIVTHLRGRPSIVHYHGGNADRFFSRAPRHALALLGSASLRVTPSVFLQRVFQRHHIAAVVIPNAIDLTRFTPRSRSPFGVSPHVIVTRNLEVIYDIPTAIRAFLIIQQVFQGARLTIAGSGPELGRLQAMTRSLSLEGAVQFTGRIENDLIPTLYASADCMLNPSRVDNMPISILEAFASGVPVISTDVGGIADMVVHGVSGYLVPPGDHQTMARDAIQVLQRPDLAATLTANGLAQVQSCACPHVGSKWLATYNQLISPGSAT